MLWITKYLMGQILLMEEKPNGEGGGGGGGAGTDDTAALKQQIADLQKKLEESTTKKPTGEGGLTDAAKKQREEDEKRKTDHSAMESAMRFTLSSKDFLKEHEGIFPNEVADLFKAADKERYDSEVHKANALKDGIIQEFFKVQANLDLLTSTQKNSVENYLKLTKTGREEKAQHVFENILEPALVSLKREKKAQELNRAKNGLGGTDQDLKYRNKLVEGSRKHYLREKK